MNDVDQLLDCAAAVCSRAGGKLTTLRRQVLELVIKSPQPAGAYDLLQRFSAVHGRTGPPTIYRALEFLIQAGLVHKVQRLAAYVACTHHLRHDHEHPAHHASVQFLICTQCCRVTELDDPRPASALTAAAARDGFRVQQATIEAEGVCQACVKASPRAAALPTKPPLR